jgi:hypothetical protein
VDVITKREIVKASSEKEGEKVTVECVQVHLATVQQKMLADFVSNRSRNLFAILGMPDRFLVEDPEFWNCRDDFKAAEAIVKTQAVTNDYAERGVALIQARRSEVWVIGYFKSKEQL